MTEAEAEAELDAEYHAAKNEYEAAEAALARANARLSRASRAMCEAFDRRCAEAEARAVKRERMRYNVPDDYCGQCGGPCLRRPRHGEGWA